jgi:hypothetical protein
MIPANVPARLTATHRGPRRILLGCLLAVAVGAGAVALMGGMWIPAGVALAGAAAAVAPAYAVVVGRPSFVAADTHYLTWRCGSAGGAVPWSAVAGFSVDARARPTGGPDVVVHLDGWKHPGETSRAVLPPAADFGCSPEELRQWLQRVAERVS